MLLINIIIELTGLFSIRLLSMLLI